MGLKSIESSELETEWRAAANTYLGLTVSGYPNMFHMVSSFRAVFRTLLQMCISHACGLSTARLDVVR